jgi:tetratricopeptide (TPR) repeat protein
MTLNRFSEIVEKHNERSAFADGEELRLMTIFHCGSTDEAHQGLIDLERQYGFEALRSRIARFQVDRFVALRVALAATFWTRGDHRQAIALNTEALNRATELGHLISQSHAIAHGALPLAIRVGQLDLARKYAATLQHNMDLCEISIWEPLCRFFQGSIASLDNNPESVDMMYSAVEDLSRSNFLIRTPMYLALIGDAAIRFGRLDLADRAIVTALERVEQQDENWCLPEVIRVRGQLMWRRGDLPSAERTLTTAAHIAHENGYVTFELRATTRLAELLCEAGRNEEAAAVLAPIYRQFDPTFVSQDVVIAGSLLEKLGH